MEKYITIVSLKPPKSEYKEVKLYTNKSDIGVQYIRMDWEPDISPLENNVYATWDQLIDLQISEEDITRFADVFANRQIGHLTRGEW